MRLGIMMLDAASSINALKYLPQLNFTPGETGTVLFQLVDLDNQTSANSYSRYMPATGALLNAQLFSNNNANALSKIATQPFPSDPSIWQFQVSSADTSKMAGVNMQVTLTQGSDVKIGFGKSVIIMAPNSPYQC